MILDNGIITGNPPYCHIPEVSIYGEAFNIHGKGSPKKATRQASSRCSRSWRTTLWRNGCSWRRRTTPVISRGQHLGAKCMGLEPEQDECGISPTHIGIEKLYTYNIIYIYTNWYIPSTVLSLINWDMICDIWRGLHIHPNMGHFIDEDWLKPVQIRIDICGLIILAEYEPNYLVNLQWLHAIS